MSFFITLDQYPGKIASTMLSRILRFLYAGVGVNPDFELTMHSYICYVTSPEFVRREHVAHKWLDPQALHTLDWAAADLPIVEKLMELKRC